MQQEKGQTALITGGSEGIGAELATCFAKRGYNLILTARSRQRLEETADRIVNVFGVKVMTVAADLGAVNGATALADTISRQGVAVDVLVNNAGCGLHGAFVTTDLSAQLGIVDLNDRAMVELTHRFFGPMLKRGRGGILNVSSTAAFLPGPFMSVYYASKAFMLSFSEALWEEARDSGVKVSCLCPGPTASRFRERAGATATRLARAGEAMSSEEVARIGCEGFHRNQRVVVPGRRNRWMTRIAPFVPRNMALRTVRKMLSVSEA